MAIETSPFVVAGAMICFRYQNHRGDTGVRSVVPTCRGLYFGTSPYHDGDQWFLEAYDFDRKGIRTFALADILNWVDR